MTVHSSLRSTHSPEGSKRMYRWESTVGTSDTFSFLLGSHTPCCNAPWGIEEETRVTRVGDGGVWRWCKMNDGWMCFFIFLCSPFQRCPTGGHRPASSSAEHSALRASGETPLCPTAGFWRGKKNNNERWGIRETNRADTTEERKPSTYPA